MHQKILKKETKKDLKKKKKKERKTKQKTGDLKWIFMRQNSQTLKLNSYLNAKRFFHRFLTCVVLFCYAQIRY